MRPTRHEEETDRNAEVWRSKPLLRDIYRQFHRHIEAEIDPSIRGRVVEIGSGVGNFAESRSDVLTSDRWVVPWLDLACDAYHLPFRPQTISHLVLFDVFHHLSAPAAFLDDAHRVLAEHGRVILFEPFISATSRVVYGLFHPEPIGWRTPTHATPSGEYYAAQGNATKLFFRARSSWLHGWSVERRAVFCSFAYLLSGGFSRPALYPRRALSLLGSLDERLSRFPNLFGARCLIVLRRRSRST